MKKELPKIVIALFAGVALGFAAQSVLAIGFKKMRTAVLLAEAEAQVKGLRQKVVAFKADQGRYPASAAEMMAQGFWTPDAPPVERLRGQARWVSRWDGDGGFLYLSSTGQIYLNTDLKREKLTRADMQKLRDGDLVPAGVFY